MPSLPCLLIDSFFPVKIAEFFFLVKLIIRFLQQNNIRGSKKKLLPVRNKKPVCSVLRFIQKIILLFFAAVTM
jgi:hypothetical protein